MKNDDFIIDKQAILLESQSLLEHMPCAVGIKNQDCIYVATNLKTAQLTGFKQPGQMLGITDAELNCPAAELSEKFQQQDAEVISNGDPQTNIDICEYAGKQLKVFLSTKKKIVDQERNPFLLFTMTEIPVQTLSIIFNKLHTYNNATIKAICASYAVTNPKVSDSDKQQAKQLTPRQTECLFYLLQGKTLKAIAYQMNRSIKTIEEHVSKLKQIFNCYSKSELIEKAYALGYAQIIPPSLLGFDIN